VICRRIEARRFAADFTVRVLQAERIQPLGLVPNFCAAPARANVTSQRSDLLPYNAHFGIEQDLLERGEVGVPPLASANRVTSASGVPPL
jgi:hypothetical protein